MVRFWACDSQALILMVRRLAIFILYIYLGIYSIMSNHTHKVEIMNNFNEINSKKDLAFLLDIPLKKLTYILYVKNPEDYYKSFVIPKKIGEQRFINAPQDDLKELL